MHFAAVGLYDSADAIETKPVMALADFPKRLASPIVQGHLKLGFWLLDGKKESSILRFGSHNDMAFTATMPESISKKLAKRIRLARRSFYASLPRNPKPDTRSDWVGYH
jgi:hypothetical protein